MTFCGTILDGKPAWMWPAKIFSAVSGGCQPPSSKSPWGSVDDSCWETQAGGSVEVWQAKYISVKPLSIATYTHLFRKYIWMICVVGKEKKIGREYRLLIRSKIILNYLRLKIAFTVVWMTTKIRILKIGLTSSRQFLLFFFFIIFSSRIEQIISFSCLYFFSSWLLYVTSILLFNIYINLL